MPPLNSPPIVYINFLLPEEQYRILEKVYLAGKELPHFQPNPAARLAPPRCPILRRDLPKIRETIKKLKRTSQVL